MPDVVKDYDLITSYTSKTSTRANRVHHQRAEPSFTHIRDSCICTTQSTHPTCRTLESCKWEQQPRLTLFLSQLPSSSPHCMTISTYSPSSEHLTCYESFSQQRNSPSPSRSPQLSLSPPNNKEPPIHHRIRRIDIHPVVFLHNPKGPD